MQTRTTPPEESVALGDDRVVETEVETVRTRERVAGGPVDTVATPRAVATERSEGYFESLPERLRAVAFVVVAALELVLGIRFLLHAYGANTSSGFVGFIDDVSWPFVRPFADTFSSRSWEQGVVEISTLVAMAVYFLVFALIGMLITALAPRLSGDTGGAA